MVAPTGVTSPREEAFAARRRGMPRQGRRLSFCFCGRPMVALTMTEVFAGLRKFFGADAARRPPRLERVGIETLSKMDAIPRPSGAARRSHTAKQHENTRLLPIVTTGGALFCAVCRAGVRFRRKTVALRSRICYNSRVFFLYYIFFEECAGVGEAYPCGRSNAGMRTLPGFRAVAGASSRG